MRYQTHVSGYCVWVLLLLQLQHAESLNSSTDEILPGVSSNNLTSMLCIESFSQTVDKLYNNGTNSLANLEKLVRKQFAPCLLQATGVSKGWDVRMLATDVLTPNSSFSRQTFEQLKKDFNADTPLPYRIDFEFLPVNAWNQLVDEILMETRRNLSNAAHTGYLYGGIQVPVFANNGAMADLSDLVVAEGAEFGWLDILPFVRQQMSTYGGKLVGIPLDMRVNMIYYRLDVLKKFKLDMPSTYDDLLKIAAIVNGTRMAPGGKPMWALCNPYLGDRGNCTTAHNHFWDVLAPYVQSQGPTQGMAVDPSDLTLLFDSEAGSEALNMIAQLLQYTLPNNKCNGQYSEEFAAGQCVITFGRVAQFKNNNLGVNSTIRGKSAGYPCPGSTRVLDRTTKKLVPCTYSNCPFASTSLLMDGTTALVNSAPFSPAAGLAAAVSSVVPPASRLSTFRFLSYVAKSDELHDAVLDPLTFLGPFRQSHFNLSMWVAKGYDKESAAQFLNSTQQLLGNHPNLALPPNFVEFSTAMTTHLRDCFRRLLAKQLTPEEMLKELVGKWAWWLTQWGTDNSLKELRAALNWVPPPNKRSRPSIIQQLEGKASQQTNWRPLAIALSVLGVLLLAVAALAIVYWRSRRLGMGLFGAVLPPHEGSATTLLVTDMQDSTILWETLPMSVMDSVLKVHHNCLRSLLPGHRGYESATEGDSFILAFHDPHSALTYALEAQKALLQASWPLELLEHVGCKPVYMKLVDRDPFDIRLDTANGPGPHNSHDEPEPPMRPSRANIWDRSRMQANVDQLEGETVEFTELCRRAWGPVSPTDAMSDGDVVLAFRGVRVRMGLYSGVGHGETLLNVIDDRRMHYVGPCLAAAKLVADCGAGGSVSLGGSTYNQLPMEKLWKSMKLWHAGLHLLDPGLPAAHIYQVLPMELSCRAACLPHVRSLSQLKRSALQAPTGTIAIGFMKVAGLDSLGRWNPAITEEAVKLWRQVVLQHLKEHEGYLVEANEDLMLVAFGQVDKAMMWATHCTRALMHANWPEDLLGHEMGEAVSVLLESEREGEWRREVMMRGLRVKVGLDRGPVLCSVQPMTGKMAYCGRVMNRAARIAAKATPGQVLTTSYTWTAANCVAPLVAAPMGRVKLKGIMEDIWLVQVKISSDADPPLQHLPPSGINPPEDNKLPKQADVTCPAPLFQAASDLIANRNKAHQSDRSRKGRSIDADTGVAGEIV